jgi:hypothetical protein
MYKKVKNVGIYCVKGSNLPWVVVLVTQTQISAPAVLSCGVTNPARPDISGHTTGAAVMFIVANEICPLAPTRPLLQGISETSLLQQMTIQFDIDYSIKGPPWA